MTSPDLAAFRRRLAAGLVARWAVTLIGAAGGLLTLVPTPASKFGTPLLLAAVALYIYLSYRALQVSRETLQVPDQLARGDTEAAEQLLTRALRTFSIFPAQRVIELHHLSLLRQSQGRHREAVELATATLALRSPEPISRAAGLLRLESLLELGDLPRAHQALLELMREPLPLLDAARLLAGRIRYESAVGAHHHLLHELPHKLELLALLPAAPAADGCQRLARAARAVGRPDLADFLAARALCLVPAETLAAHFPDDAQQLRQAAARLGLT